MIIQIDHLALSTNNIEKSAQYFDSLGYQNKFTERNLNNLKIKKDLLKIFSKTHHLSLFTKEGDINVELLDHGHINQQDGFIIPTFENQFNEFIVKTKDVKKSIQFWQCFGFKLLDNSANLEFISPLQKVPCRIILQKDEADRKYFLDDRGLNCIAFVSTAMEDDRQIIKNKGFVVTGIEEFKVNNKKLKICFAIGPGGELAEIIGISK